VKPVHPTSPVTLSGVEGPTQGLSRRELLVAGSAALALSCSGTPGKPDAGLPTVDAQAFDHATRFAFTPETIGESAMLFPQTVAAGAMQQAQCVLWTRAVGVASVVLRVWRDLGSSAEVALVTEKTLAVPDHGNVKVVVDGLAPATRYRYGFFSTDLSARSPIGQVRTAFPDDWKVPLTVGATSCASYRHRPFHSLEAQARAPMDLYLFLGDVAYNDGAEQLAAFRAKWVEQLVDPGFKALLPTTGGYLLWDDHDFANNFDPEALGPTHPLIVNGKQAFIETLPVDDSYATRLWRSYRWGQTAEFFLLDTRTERLPSTRETPAAQLISPAQLDWLKGALSASPCHFKVVLTSVPITTMPAPSWGGQADRWQGYQAQREALLGFLDSSGLDNVWFLSGDFHLGLVMHLEKTGPRARYREICGGPAGNINPLALVLEPGQEANREVAFPKAQFDYASGAFQATTLTFDPIANTVRAVFVDPAQGDKVTLDRSFTFGV
jgi:alkaline phosphatase D